MTLRGRSSDSRQADATAARLAATSRLVADQLEATWPAIRTALGDEGATWLDLGERLARGTGPAVGATLAYLRLEPARVERVGLAALAGWVEAAVALGAASTSLAAAFCETTAPLLGVAAPSLYDALAAQALALRSDGGWRGERVAHALVSAAPAVARVLEADDLPVWCALAGAVRAALDEGLFFRALPEEVGTWTAAERARWLEGARSLAARSPTAAVAFYRDVPGVVTVLPTASRAALLDVLATTAAGAVPSELHALLPVAGALVLDVPQAHRVEALAAATQVAEVFPAGAVALLRVLPRVFEEASAERLAPWVAHGLALADDYPEAAHAYFALESRTSVSVLRASSVAATLDEAQSVLRKVLQMLSGSPASPRAVGRFQLRPPLEIAPGGGGIALPPSIDVLDGYEDNRRLYGVLTAWLAGRRLYGTYDDAAIPAALDAEDRAPLLDEIFLVTEGFRVAHRLAAEYLGIAAEITWACRRLLAVWDRDPSPPMAVVLDALLALALDARAADRPAPPWLAGVALVALPALKSLAEPDATVADALAVASRLAPLFAHLATPAPLDPETLEFLPILLDAGDGDEPFATGLAETDDDVAATRRAEPARLPEELLRELQVLLDDSRTGEGSGTQLSVEELRRLLESGLLGELSQGSGTEVDANGLYVTQLVGKLLGERRELRRVAADGVGPRRVARLPLPSDASPVFYYDEWDHVIGDYRPAWCALREIMVPDDAGVFFERALARHAELVPELRRCFQQVRPERYQSVRGLEDGESIDWNAAVEARVERRVRGTASTKLYTARKRQEREVATLFLLDMSASTDEAAEGSAVGERIVDIAKDALVIMAAALEEIGDTFAIYGFSGQGRERVEVYPIKSFGERLTPTVKGRLGGIEPKGSTRMGTALRHATALMRGLTAPSQHLVLLSDGFPQDLDYGHDRQSHVYGIRDTATAMRETQAAGIRPFCITVDLAGHDYLRQMCDPDTYVVIERVADLPRELPRIYQRLVRAA